MTPKVRVPKVPEPKLDNLVDVQDPELYYSVQYFLQQYGIILVNLTTGDHIYGQVNLPQIGLIIPAEDNPKKEKSFGLIPASGKKSKTLPQKFQNVDATLVCDPSLNSNDQPFLLIVQVIDHGYIDLWKDLLQEIANAHVKRIKGQLVPQIVFGLTSLCVPDEKNPDSAKNAVLSEIQGYGFGNDNISAVDNQDLFSSDEQFDNEP